MQAADNKHAKNTLTQKLMGKTGTTTVKLDLAEMANGQKAGLCLLGQNVHEIGVNRVDNTLQLFVNNNGQITQGPTLKQGIVYLRIVADLNANHTILQFSLNGKDFEQLGEVCVLAKKNYWKGVRPGLFSYNTIADDGTALFDWFHYQYDGPKGND